MHCGMITIVTSCGGRGCPLGNLEALPGNVRVYLEWNSLFLIGVLELNADSYVSSLGIDKSGKTDPVNHSLREKFPVELLGYIWRTKSS